MSSSFFVSAWNSICDASPVASEAGGGGGSGAAGAAGAASGVQSARLASESGPARRAASESAGRARRRREADGSMDGHVGATWLVHMCVYSYL